MQFFTFVQFLLYPGFSVISLETVKKCQKGSRSIKRKWARLGPNRNLLIHAFLLDEQVLLYRGTRYLVLLYLGSTV